MNQKHRIALEVFEMKVLRRMYGGKRKWRVSENENKWRADGTIWSTIHNWYAKISNTEKAAKRVLMAGISRRIGRDRKLNDCRLRRGTWGRWGRQQFINRGEEEFVTKPCAFLARGADFMYVYEILNIYPWLYIFTKYVFRILNVMFIYNSMGIIIIAKWSEESFCFKRK